MRRILSCYFDGPGTDGRWPRMAGVFAHTARLHCPEWQLTLSRIEPPRRKFNESENHLSNTVKLEHWCDMVKACDDGDEVLLIDADTFIRRPLDEVWAQPFDIAYTVRPAGFPNPFNCGVVFLRVSPKVRHFMHWWLFVNNEMRSNRQLADQYRKYVGLNQRALAYLLKERSGDIGHLLPLSCVEWNCEDSTWPAFHPEITRIVHAKSQLQSVVFGRNVPAKPQLKAIAREWHALEKEANGGK